MKRHLRATIDPTLHHSPATLFSRLWWCNGIKLNNNAVKGIKTKNNDTRTTHI